MSNDLTGKQELFCLEYIKSLNATQAAIKAGYAEKTAAVTGFENLRKPNIQNRIAELQEARNNELNIDASYVLRRLIEIDQMDVKDILNDDGTIKRIIDWPTVWRTSLSGLDITESAFNDDVRSVLKKIKWPDKVKNLELLGKHININAFTERIKADVELEAVPIQVIVNVKDARKHVEPVDDEE